MRLEDLWNALTPELTRDPKGAGVASILQRYTNEADDWREFALFGPAQYSRNLLGASELFELLLLCWNPGQRSPIHNHEGQRCWMATLEGTIEETHYRPCPDGTGPMQPGARRTFAPGQVAFISDDIALHEIAPSNGSPGVSLHLYSKPIRRCRVYCGETGRVEWRQLAYYSIRGVVQLPGDPCA